MTNALPKLKLPNDGSPTDVSDLVPNVSKKLNYLLERELNSISDPNGVKVLKMVKAPSKNDIMSKAPISGRSISPKQNRDKSYQNQLDFLSLWSQLQEESNKNDRISRKKSLICSKMLEVLSEEHVNFRTEISLLKKEVDKYLFCMFEDIIEKILKRLRKPFLDKYITYYDGIVLLLKEIDAIGAERNQAIEEKERIIRVKDAEVETIKKELEDTLIKYKNSDVEFRARHIKETTASEKKIDELNNTVLQYEGAVFELNQKLNIIRENNSKNLSEIHERHQIEMQDHKSIIKKLEENLEVRKSELRDLKIYLDKMAHDQKNAVLSLKICKDKIEQLENTILKLNSDNIVLAKRAAVSFDNLTPRPKLEKLSEMNLTDRKRTTIEVLDMVYTKISEEIETLRKENMNMKRFIKKRTLKDSGASDVFKKAVYLRDTSRKLKNTLIMKNNYQNRGSIMARGSILAKGSSQMIKTGLNDSLADIIDAEISSDDSDEHKTSNLKIPDQK